ncbi:hypothetical protein [Legionella clemsonensis]|uniref:Uncharacterized protein n=1 Tax=Legionella clemsonensis TaxID=1867846 RepID=A0A222P5K0_9GAMM|nr:hypothetical protein [Legionella clemsonensis]ASQ47055.1 hypothetical protein clem_12600 [Legionella clemsonensis]
MNSQIQQALAKLITNPKYCENYFNFRNEIIASLNLSADVADMLDSFYNENKQKFQASARILKKNRWDDIKASLPITADYIHGDVLEKLWENYLNALNLDSNVPKNPLSESIHFLNYVEDNNSLSLLDKQIIKYEKTRNEVTYQHHNDFNSYPQTIRHDEAINCLENFNVYIHNCFRIEQFSYNIPVILKMSSKEISAPDNTLILFFKNLKKEGVGTIKISYDVKNILLQSVESPNLSEAYKYFKNKLTVDEFKELFQKLEQIGVLIIQYIEN